MRTFIVKHVRHNKLFNKQGVVETEVEADSFLSAQANVRRSYKDDDAWDFVRHLDVQFKPADKQEDDQKTETTSQ
jgi:hypothetical protein